MTLLLLRSKIITLRNEANPRIQTEEKLNLLIPDARWEPNFFEALDERISGTNIHNLRTVVLPNNDLEVRFWFDALPYRLDGVILRRSGDQWSAVLVQDVNEHLKSEIQQRKLPAPKSGWEDTWEKLVKAGLLTLPDASSISQCQSGTLDGSGFVIEINKNKTYRTYRYGNPQLAECSEAKQIVLISKIIINEFDLETPKSK